MTDTAIYQQLIQTALQGSENWFLQSTIYWTITGGQYALLVSLILIIIRSSFGFGRLSASMDSMTKAINTFLEDRKKKEDIEREKENKLREWQRKVDIAVFGKEKEKE